MIWHFFSTKSFRNRNPEENICFLTSPTFHLCIVCFCPTHWEGFEKLFSFLFFVRSFSHDLDNPSQSSREENIDHFDIYLMLAGLNEPDFSSLRK